jgi:prepilin-type processing-associated H-X9-DG protein
MKSTDRFPMPNAVYPEYWNDGNLSVCPSDSNEKELNRSNDFGTDITAVVCSNASIIDLGLDIVDADGRGTYLHPLRALTSYHYLGFALDRSNMNDTLFDKSGTGSVGCFEGLVMPSQLEAQESMKYWSTLHLGSPITPPSTSYQEIMDEDLDLSNFYGGSGNGGGNVIHRMREGVARFMIVDVDNPAATSLAQSDLVLMFDYVSVNVEKFSHIPGGSNILYLDGHVEFKKYPSLDFPVHTAYAQFSRQYWEDCG